MDSCKTQPFNAYIFNLLFCSLTKSHTEKLTDDRLYVPTSKERRRDKTPTHTTDVQSLMKSVGELQVVDITPVLYVSITEPRLMRPTIVTRCCYNSSCLPYVRSEASSLFFSSTKPDHRALRQSTFLPVTSPELMLADFTHSFKTGS